MLQPIHTKDRKAIRYRRMIYMLAVLCVFLAGTAAGLLWYTRGEMPADQPVPQPHDVLEVFLPYEESPMPPEYVYVYETEANGALIALYWGGGVFFDAPRARLVLPSGAYVTHVETSFLFDLHQVTLAGVDLPHRRLVLPLMGNLASHVYMQGHTITIRTPRGTFAEMAESGGYVQFVDPRTRYHTIVVLDPGHGGHDPGAPGRPAGGRRIYEAEIVLNISNHMMDMLDTPGVLFLPTRTQDVFVPLTLRYQLANQLGDYFVSIHCNGNLSSQPRGTITYHNVFYGHPLSGRETAQRFQDALVDLLDSRDRGIVPSTGFVTMRNAQVPAVLLEILFMSNPLDAAILADPDVQYNIARTLVAVINDLPPAR